MAGKTYFNFIIIIKYFLFLPCLSLDDQVVLKNSLVFQRVSSRSWAINSDAVTFSRALDLTRMVDLITHLVVAAETFAQECQLLAEKSPSITEFVIPSQQELRVPIYRLSPTKVPMREALKSCELMGGHLPEIVSATALNEFKRFMTAKDLPFAPAGIRWNEDELRFVFRSDGKDASDAITMISGASMEFGGYLSSYYDTYRHITDKEGINKGLSTNNLLMYRMTPSTANGVTISVATNADQASTDYIVCQIPNLSPPATLISAFGSAICEREEPVIKNLTISICLELDAILQLESGDISDGPKLYVNSSNIGLGSHHRSKRAAIIVPALASFIGKAALFGTGGVAAANIVSSSIYREAPLSWFGILLAKIFGFASQSDFMMTLQAIEENTRQISALKVDVQEISEITNKLVHHVNNLTILFQEQSQALLDYFVVQDLKDQIKTSLLQIQISGLKIVGALDDTIHGRLNPYIMPQAELEALARSFQKEHNIVLSTERTSVVTSLVRAGNKLHILMRTPIRDAQNYFTFYRVDPIPFFVNNTAFMPEVDIKYFGITSSNMDYAVISPEEFQQCLATPGDCQISAMRRPISPAEHCVVNDWIMPQPSCPVKEVKLTSPFMKMIGNKTIYSVADTYTVLINCFDPKTAEPMRSLLQLHGQGTAILQPRCTIKLNDGKTYHVSPPAPRTVELHESNMLQILHHMKPQEILNISWNIKAPAMPLLSPHKLTQLPDSPFLKQLQDRLSSSNQVAIGIQLICILVTIFSVVGFILCCCKPIRLWCRSCLLCQTPDNWYNRITKKPGGFWNSRFTKWSFKGFPSAPPPPGYQSPIIRYPQPAPWQHGDGDQHFVLPTPKIVAYTASPDDEEAYVMMRERAHNRDDMSSSVDRQSDASILTKMRRINDEITSTLQRADSHTNLTNDMANLTLNDYHSARGSMSNVSNISMGSAATLPSSISSIMRRPIAEEPAIELRRMENSPFSRQNSMPSLVPSNPQTPRHARRGSMTPQQAAALLVQEALQNQQ